ncbi:MAG: hypothetical protein ACP5RH_00090 [Leptodesmis sp.]|uniref:hypothetical protein n=1 Tax=Leptodesmis sp. TaxID=3100501 RepID=UPI003D0B50AF
MLNDDGQFSTSSASSPTGRSAVKPGSLTRWIQQVIGQSDIRVKMRLRGNNLHILCEGPDCPKAEVIVPQLQAALATAPLAVLLGDDAAQVHRALVHGRQVGQKEAVWSQRINIVSRNSLPPKQQKHQGSTHRVNRTAVSPSATTIAQPPDPAPAAELDETLELAQQGQPDALARYLSHAFNTLNIAIRAKVRPYSPKTPSSVTDDSRADQPPSMHRLLVVCESIYSPDPALLAAPIAQKLRELELRGFRDALVFGQVRGEAQPEWVTRVDLTPPDEILQEWSRWGDIQAITRLLNRSLASQHLKFSALLKDSTLHLTCAGDAGSPPEQTTAIAAIRSWLQSLGPQGIHAVTIYGVASLPDESSEVLPAWVHWLDLPAAHQPDLALPTLELAKQGNLAAITFLLTRLLNPNLEDKLAIGGIRVQIRQKEDLLHIMTDALVCPRQDAIAAAIVRCLKPLQIASVAGVRIYGRRAGQQQPLWNYGMDFVPRRHRLVPEATPEFTASDVYVDDLLAPPGAIVRWSELPPDDWRAKLYQWFDLTLKQVQRSLIATQLFIPSETTRLAPALTPANLSPTPSSRQQLAIAALWGTVGLLLVVQTDWLLGRWIQPLIAQDTAPAKPIAAPPAAPPVVSQAASPIPAVPLNKPKVQDWQNFNTSGFTQPGSTVVSPPAREKTPKAPSPLPASPMQAKADQLPDFKVDYPTFNSRQLDRQLVVYQRYLEVNGPPDVLIVGSSRALRGIDPTQLKATLTEQGYAGVKVFNLGVNGATVQVVDWLIRQVLPQEKLPKLILFADGARAFNSGRPDLTYNGILASPGYRTLVAGTPPIAGTTAAKANPAQPQLSGANVNSSPNNSSASPANPYQALNESFNQVLGEFSVIYSQRDRLKTKLREQLMAWLPSQRLSSDNMMASSNSLLNSSSPPAAATSAPSLTSDGEDMVDIEGFLPLSIQFNPVTYYQKYARVPGDYDTDYEAFSLQGIQTEALVNLAQFAKARQIPLIFVNLPLTQEYLDPIRKQHEQEFQAHLLSLAPQLGMAFRDLSGALTTQPNYFSDPSHLNRYGAYEVSRRLAQDVMIPWQVIR